jgi:hypothetical protein
VVVVAAAWPSGIFQDLVEFVVDLEAFPELA